ncbi:MAG: class I SAM-dependent methyltransferase [Deltaproteobacteria bacterium]
MADSVSKIFTGIYDDGVWGQGSGPGSASHETIAYRRFLQEFLLWNQIERVVDVGCGDWQFSRFVDWSGVDYTGVDVVASVIETNQERFGSENVHFALSDGTFDALPEADLLIAKDVLQHLDTRRIQSFLGAASAYRFVLVTNTAEPVARTNAVIKNGGFRPVDLRKKPFYVSTTVVFSFCGFAGRQDVHLLVNPG